MSTARSKTSGLAHVEQMLGVSGLLLFSLSLDREEVLYISPLAESWYGAPVAVLGRHPMFWQESIAPEDRDEVYRVWQHLQHGAPATLNYRLQGPDGRQRLIRHRIWVAEDAMGRALSIEHCLEERADSAPAAILDRLPDPWLLCDGQGYVVQANPAAEALWPGRSESMLGRRVQVCLAPWAQTLLDVQAWPAVRERGTWRGELSWRLAGGEEAAFSAVLCRVPLAGGDHISISTTDLRPLRRREQALRNARDQLESDLFTARRMLDNVTHHMLPALENIEGLSVMLVRDHSGTVAHEICTALEVIKGTTRQALKLARAADQYRRGFGEPEDKKE